jgi:hypothetical protein
MRGLKPPPLCGISNWERQDSEAHDVIAAVYVEDFAGYGAG